jgi:hypothetical protein
MKTTITIITVITSNITMLVAIGDPTVTQMGVAAMVIGTLAGVSRSKSDGLPSFTLIGPPPRSIAPEKKAATPPVRQAA